MENNKSLTITKTELLKIYSPKEMQIAFKNITSAIEAIGAGTDAICTLANTLGSEKVCALIKLHLIELNEILNLKKPLTERMIDVIAEDIMDEFKLLTMADVYLVFKRIRTGYYGEMYESINGAKMIPWFREYFHERCDCAAEISIREHEENKQEVFPRKDDGFKDFKRNYKIENLKKQ